MGGSYVAAMQYLAKKACGAVHLPLEFIANILQSVANSCDEAVKSRRKAARAHSWTVNLTGQLIGIRVGVLGCLKSVDGVLKVEG